MRAINHKKCHTLTLLRKLKEKGYVLEVSHGGGSRNFSSLRIPLDKLGRIAPQPIAADLLAEQKEQRRRKKPAAAPVPIIDQAQPAPASEPEAAPTRQLVPVTPPAAMMTPEQRWLLEEEDRLLNSVEFRQQKLEESPPGSRARRTWQSLTNQAVEAYEAFKAQFGGQPPPAAIQCCTSPVQIQEV